MLPARTRMQAGRTPMDCALEVEAIGYDEYMSPTNGVTIVEWPERAGAGYWREALSLRLDFAADGARSLTAQVPPAWEGRWPPQ